MSAATPIEWTDRTWNPLAAIRKSDGKRGWFCTKVSPGCANCYAEAINKRLGTGHPYVRTHEREIDFWLLGLDAPQRWRKPQRVFVNSMTDLFHEAVPFDFIERVFAAMALASQHTFQVLTKRPKRMREFMEGLEAAAVAWQPRTASGVFTPTDVLNIRHMARSRTHNALPTHTWPLPNVWLGTSTEDQERLEERLPELLKTPSAVRFLSAEPLLGRLDVLGLWNRIVNQARAVQHLASEEPLTVDESAPLLGAALHWVIVGGESGPKARPCEVGHVRNLVMQCELGETSCFVKQLGKRPMMAGQPMKLKHSKGGDLEEWGPMLRVRDFPRRAV